MSKPHAFDTTVGLFETGQRSMMLYLLLWTAAVLLLFAGLQWQDGNWLFAGLEVACSLLLAFSALRVRRMSRITWLIYAYLLPTSAFLLYIIVMPDASKTAFVWLYSIPPLAYLLLGKMRGLLISVPFLMLGFAAYLSQFGWPSNAHQMIDLGNAVLCALAILVFVHLYESRRQEAYAALALQARVDSLTGLANRAHFQQTLQHGLAAAERSGLPQVLVIMDIDHFKRINDQYGHQAGDQALQQVSKCLRERVRLSDSVGRIGGEEFAILLHNTELHAAEPMIQALREQIANTRLQLGEDTLTLSATFGLAQWPADGRSMNELFRKADMRLYRGKQGGRNRLVCDDHSSLPANHTSTSHD